MTKAVWEPLPSAEQARLPNHLELPSDDGAIVQNFMEHPQSMLLSDVLAPVFAQLHPDGQYCIGQDCGIYYQNTDPPEQGVVAPVWFYVPDVPALLNGQVRRSYVLWHEPIHPSLLIEFVSGDGSQERDTTPSRGKFWVYENAVLTGYYVIFDAFREQLEVFRREGRRLRRLPANAAGRVAIPELGIELGLWRGKYQNLDLVWLRAWDAGGRLLSTAEERAERLAAKLRELGVDPTTI